jgi:hypothetical protein
MEVKIYRDVPMLPDKLIGRIDDEGKVHNVGSGEDEFIGWIDYEEGEVYDADDELMGWLEEDGLIIGHYDDDDEDIGYVTEDGEVYGYDDDGEDVYLGKVVIMEDATEGAAAMLLFFDIFEDEDK